jgi:aryl-alcohol dehydrogenase-like predicted oxidoreductase
MSDPTCLLGLGLIGIGRHWGAVDTGVPSESDALSFLEFSVEQGVTFFDTAPAYGLSEFRLGRFLRDLSPELRAGLRIATKFGEHWDAKTGGTYVDHGFDALVRSLETSLEILGGQIDLLQVHKSSLEVLRSDDLLKAIEYARSLGVPAFGVSANEETAIAFALRSNTFEAVQMPLNAQSTQFAHLAAQASDLGKFIVANRPFNMGQVIADLGQPSLGRLRDVQVGAFEAVCRLVRHGVVLSGTKNKRHLADNLCAFREALLRTRGVGDVESREERIFSLGHQEQE